MPLKPGLAPSLMYVSTAMLRSTSVTVHDIGDADEAVNSAEPLMVAVPNGSLGPVMLTEWPFTETPSLPKAPVTSRTGPLKEPTKPLQTFLIFVVTVDVRPKSILSTFNDATTPALQTKG